MSLSAYTEHWQAVGLPCLFCSLLIGCGKKLWLVYRSQEAGTRPETVYPIRTCKGCHHLRYGTDACDAFNHTGRYFNHNERAGFGTPQQTVLPTEIVTAIEDCGFFESIPLWAVTLIGSLFIWVLSFIMILSVYGRFFKNRYCTDTAVNLCRGTDAECRKKLP